MQHRGRRYASIQGRRSGAAVQHGHQLLAADAVIGAGPVGNAGFHGPGNSIFIGGLSAKGIHTVQPGQNRIDHGPSHGSVGSEAVCADAVEQFPGGNGENGVSGPVVPRVNEILGVVHDLHRGAAGDGELNAGCCGLAGSDDLLSAILMNQDGHRAGIPIADGDLHLGFACAAGQFNADCGGAVAVLACIDLGRNAHSAAAGPCIGNGLFADFGADLCSAVSV